MIKSTFAFVALLFNWCSAVAQTITPYHADTSSHEAPAFLIADAGNRNNSRW